MARLGIIRATGDLMFFDYCHSHPHMSYGVVDASGKATHQTTVELQGARLPHNMAITENYSILHDLPLFNDEEAFSHGRHTIYFDSTVPSRFGVIPRYGNGDSIRWFEFSPCFPCHTINAYLVDHDLKILRWIGIRKYNVDNGANTSVWSDGHDHCWYSEPTFAPADNQCGEDHGYVITFCIVTTPTNNNYRYSMFRTIVRAGLQECTSHTGFLLDEPCQIASAA